MTTTTPKFRLFWPLVLAIWCQAGQPVDTMAAWFGNKKDKEEVARALTTLPQENHPMAEFWRDPEFLKRFYGEYGFQGRVEPSLTRTEDVVFQKETLQPLMQSNPEEARKALAGYVTGESNPYFDFILAKLHYQNGNLTNAVRQYEAALAKLPTYRSAHQELGFLLVREQRYDEALTHLTRTIELGGASTHTFGLLGYCYLNKEYYLSAEAAYKNAMLLDPNNKDWKLGLIQCLVATESFRPALRLLDELLDQHPQDANLWALQSGVFLQMEQVDKAAVNLEMLRGMGKADVRNLMLLGDIYMMQDAKDLALPVYMEAIDRAGAEDLSRSLRAADILATRGAWEEARQMFARIREVAGDAMSDDDEMSLLKLESRVAMATGNGERAIRTLEEIITRNPLDGEALLLAGDYYGANGEPEKAGNRYQLAAKISGFEAEAWVKEAQLRVKSQEYADAVELLRKAQRVRPKDNIGSYLEKVEEAAARAGRR